MMKQAITKNSCLLLLILSCFTWKIQADPYNYKRTDNPPTVQNIPDQTIGQGGQFNSFNLHDFLTEQDGDSIHWTYQFNAPSSTDPSPSWNIDESNFQFSMNVTAVVETRGETAIGANHLLAAFVGNELRGVTQAIQAGNDWLFFLTLFSNTNGEQVEFKFFDANASLVLPVNQLVTFETDGIIGSAVDPIQIRAGFLLVNISNNAQVSLTILDDTWLGSESIDFRATDALTNDQFSDEDEAVFTILNDQAPVLNGIPNQTVSLADNFAAFDLDDFLTNTDNDPVSFSFTGNTALTVVIDANNQVTVTKPSNDWFGEEWIIFTVTDNTSNTLSGSDSVLFKGLGADIPPSISGIPDSKTGTGGTFPPINLNNYIDEQDGDETQISYCFAPNANPAPSPNWEVNTAGFQFSMSVVATVNSLGINTIGSNHQLAAFVDGELRGEATALQVADQWMFFLLINSNTNNELIEFKFYDATDQRILPINQTATFQNDSELGSPSQPLALRAGYLLVDIDENNQANFSLTDSTWQGSEEVIFKVTDQNTLVQLSDTDTASFSVIDMAYPNVTEIPSQSILEGDAFQVFDLDNYLIDFPTDQVKWSILGTQHLTATIDTENQVTIQPNDADWFGVETLNFIASDATDSLLADFSAATFTIINVNDTPVFTSTPVLQATEGEAYAYVVKVDDVDGDATSLQATTLPNWLTFHLNANGSATLSGTPTASEVGTHQVLLTVTDPSNAQRIQEFVITVAEFNTAPYFTSQPIQTATEGMEYHYVVTYGDDNPDDSIYINWNTLPVWLQLVDSMNGKASLIGTPLDEHTGIHTVELEVTDRLGLSNSQVFQINVADVNNSPSEILLSNDDITENQDAGTIIGLFSALDLDAADSHQFSLMAGEGDTDNGLFVIEDNRLRAFTSFDYETQTSMSIRVQTMDNSGDTVSQVFIINVLDLDDPPTGLNDELLAKNLLVFPNPASNQSAFSLDTPLMGELNIRVINTNGQVLIQKRIIKSTIAIQHKLPISTFPKGLYLIHFELNGKQAFRKLVKD